MSIFYCSEAEHLKEYREYLGYSPLPPPDDQEPLIPKEKGKGGMASTRVIRQRIQICFDAAVSQLRTNNEPKKQKCYVLRQSIG